MLANFLQHIEDPIVKITQYVDDLKAQLVTKEKQIAILKDQLDQITTIVKGNSNFYNEPSQEYLDKIKKQLAELNKNVPPDISNQWGWRSTPVICNQIVTGNYKDSQADGYNHHDESTGKV